MEDMPREILSHEIKHHHLHVWDETVSVKLAKAGIKLRAVGSSK
jgi:hypothetical protein